MSREIWEAVETKAEKIEIAKAKGKRSRKETKREGGEKEKGKDNGSEESGRRMRDLG